MNDKVRNAISNWGGDNYSLEEQVIGTWIDNKPLYQKVALYGWNQTGTTPLFLPKT